MWLKIDLLIGEYGEGIPELLECCINCHQEAALKNPNASSAAFQNAFLGSGSVENGIASAILTLGKNHGPIIDARVVYEHFEEGDFEMIKRGVKIAGFGNSFFKDGIDPSFEPLDRQIRYDFPKVAERIDELTKYMHKYKRIYPNAALYTADVCSEARFKRGHESALFIMARIPAWINL